MIARSNSTHHAFPYVLANDRSFIEHSIKTLLSVVAALALGTILLLVSTYITFCHALSNPPLVISFGLLGFMLGSLIVGYAIKQSLQQMFLWRKNCLNIRDHVRLHTPEPIQRPSISFSKIIFPTPPDIYDSTHGISVSRIWCSIAQIISGIGLLITCCLSCHVLTDLSKEILSIGSGVMGSVLFSSGIASLYSYIISAQAISYLYLNRHKERMKEKAEKIRRAHGQHLEARIASLEAKLQNMRRQQNTLIIEYEGRLESLRKKVSPPPEDKPLQVKGAQPKRKAWYSMNLFWSKDSGDEEESLM